MTLAKGKVESGIKYLRNNFWPLRNFKDLDDVNHQVMVWLNSANKRVHQTTNEKPFDRFTKGSLNPLPALLPDFREIQTLKAYKDFGVRFDNNIYTVPPRLVGKHVTLKADSRTITIYYKAKQVAAHIRSWKKKQRTVDRLLVLNDKYGTSSFTEVSPFFYKLSDFVSNSS